jgi:penicillin-binding protein 2
MRRETHRTGVFTRRALLLMGAQAGVLSGLAARLYQVQIIDGERYRTLANDNRISERMTAPPRGRILDRFGSVLAGNKQNWRALLVAEQTNDARATLDRLSNIIELSDADRSRIDHELRRQRSFIPVLVRDFLTWDEMARVEVNAPSLPGIVVDVGLTRTYPYSDQMAHLVGYVAPPSEADVDQQPLLALPGMRVGRGGVEKYHDLALRGTAGMVQFEVNAFGRVIRELDQTEGVSGEEIGLTIDAGLQTAVVGRLGDLSASAVVLDCRNGEVMAMATTPSFDPSLFNFGVSQAQWSEWVHDLRAPLIDKATRGLYAPGSTFKMTVALAGLNSGAITPHTVFNCPGYLDIGRTRFHCWRKGGHGSLDLRGGLKNSCDVYFYNAAMHAGIDPIAAMAHRLGLGTKLDVDLPGQRVGLIPTREWRRAGGHPWELGDTIVAGIGQGYIGVTPLQLATYVARIATGREVQPHVTRRVAGVVQPGADPADWPDLQLPVTFLHVVRDGMWEVVNSPGGTAPHARLADPRWQMAGKTGSAQVRAVSRALRESGHFNSAKLPWQERPHALFVCYAPFDAPRYAVSVVVEHGNAGADTAGPIARDIMTDTLQRNPAGRIEAPGRVVAENRS